jgi:hypothetical protein
VRRRPPIRPCQHCHFFFFSTYSDTPLHPTPLFRSAGQSCFLLRHPLTFFCRGEVKGGTYGVADGAFGIAGSVFITALRSHRNGARNAGAVARQNRISNFKSGYMQALTTR